MDLLCPWESAKYFVYSSNIPTLFFYSHAPAILVALLVGFLVFYKSKMSKIGITLLSVTILFSLWSLFDLIIWATNRPDIVLFYWSLQILFEPLVYLLCFYMAYLFIKHSDLAFKWKLWSVLLYSPVVVFLPTAHNLVGIDASWCNALEGFIAQYYTYMVEAIFILAIITLTILEYRKVSARARKKEIAIFGLGVVLFLVAFSSGNIIGSFTDNWNLAQAGLIGMPIFIGFLAYLIVKFHTFQVKLFATQALVWGLVILIGSQFFFIRNLVNIVLNSFTFVATIIFGYLLIKSVKREIEQKEVLAKLNVDLEESIKQRESLVHLVTHKVKGSFTRTKFIFAGLLDGTFGKILPEVEKVAKQGLEFDNGGLETVDLVLNVANLEKGIIKYNMQSVDFREILEKTLEEKKGPIEAKDLKLETEIKDGNYKVMGDAVWLKEVVNNLLENSTKYTRAGVISVSLTDGNNHRQGGAGKILLSVKDTGIGITPEDEKNLFTEGGRGKESVRLNVDSTGYGLYSVKLIVEAHKGKVWEHSEGLDKGSQFFVELPTI